jgi:hypothetical protein
LDPVVAVVASGVTAPVVPLTYENRTVRSLRHELLAPTFPVTVTVVVVASIVVGAGTTVTVPATAFGPGFEIAEGAATVPAASAPRAIVIMSLRIAVPSLR